MYDSVAILKSYGEPSYDEYGNEVREETSRQVFVQPRSVYASEFYNAAQRGLKPSMTFVLSNKAEYSGEKILMYEGRDFSVIRADWNAQRDSIALICEEKVNGN